MNTVPSFLVSLSTITTPTVQGVWTMNAYQQERVILKAVHDIFLLQINDFDKQQIFYYHEVYFWPVVHQS